MHDNISQRPYLNWIPKLSQKLPPHKTFAKEEKVRSFQGEELGATARLDLEPTCPHLTRASHYSPSGRVCQMIYKKVPKKWIIVYLWRRRLLIFEVSVEIWGVLGGGPEEHILLGNNVLIQFSVTFIKWIHQCNRELPTSSDILASSSSSFDYTEFQPTFCLSIFRCASIS